MQTLDIPRAVALDDRSWLAEPGLYVLERPACEVRRTVARLRAWARPHRTTVHTSYDAGRLLVEVRRARV